MEHNLVLVVAVSVVSSDGIYVMKLFTIPTYSSVDFVVHITSFINCTVPMLQIRNLCQ
jgi:hypothetical protein